MLANYLEANGQTAFDFFSSIDLDGSGEIDTYEFQTALKKADVVDLPPWEMAPLMKALDLDGNGSINVPELDLTLGRIVRKSKKVTMTTITMTLTLSQWITWVVWRPRCL